MQIEQRSIVYDATAKSADWQVSFFDSLIRLNSGTWLCGLTAGRSKHDPQSSIRICRSRDQGVTWEELPFVFESTQGGIPGSVTGAEMVETSPGRLLLFSTWFDRSDPERPLFDPVTEGLLRSRQLMAVSTDEGDSWSDWQTIPTPGITGTALTGPILKWSDGAIAFPFESFKEFDDTSPTRHGSWMTVSRDGGKSFERPYLVAQDPQHQVYYWDQRLTEGARPGDFIGLFWTHDRQSKRDLRVHFLTANAYDGKGAAWQPVETSLPGQIGAPLLLEDGRILAFIVDRERPGTMRLWMSHDQGASWPESDCLTVHMHDEQAKLTQGATNVDYAQYWEDMAKWTFGHPSLRKFDGQHVLATYYAGVPGCMSIHAARIHVG